MLFKGSGVAIVTPFDKNGVVDYDTLGKLLEFNIANGTDAIISCGTTGESATMSAEEYKDVIDFTVKKVNKRIPVIVGTGSNNTKLAIEHSKLAESLGADGVLVVSPYYNKTTQDGLIAHFTKIAEAIKIDIILYNIPGRTGMNMEPKTIYELSKVDNIVGVKEASGNIDQVVEIASLCDINSFAIYSGNDSEIVPIMALGGKGVISTMANIIPKETHKITELFFKGDIAESRNLQLKLINLINNLFSETNPIPIKAALNLMKYNVGDPRLPLVPMSENKKANLEKAMKELGLI